jgi:hypothetical protein
MGATHPPPTDAQIAEAQSSFKYKGQWILIRNSLFGRMTYGYPMEPLRDLFLFVSSHRFEREG